MDNHKMLLYSVNFKVTESVKFCKQSLKNAFHQHLHKNIENKKKTVGFEDQLVSVRNYQQFYIVKSCVQ